MRPWCERYIYRDTVFISMVWVTPSKDTGILRNVTFWSLSLLMFHREHSQSVHRSLLEMALSFSFVDSNEDVTFSFTMCTEEHNIFLNLTKKTWNRETSSRSTCPRKLEHLWSSWHIIYIIKLACSCLLSFQGHRQHVNFLKLQYKFSLYFPISDMNLPQTLPCLLPPMIFALDVIYVTYIFDKLNLCFFQTDVLYSLQGLPLKSQILVSGDTEHRWHHLRDIWTNGAMHGNYVTPRATPESIKSCPRKLSWSWRMLICMMAATFSIHFNLKNFHDALRSKCFSFIEIDCSCHMCVGRGGEGVKAGCML